MSAGTDAGPWTISRLLAWTRDYLQRSGLEAPRLCAEILLAHALECERIRLYTRFEEIPSDAARGRFRELVQQAAAGRPIAYLTGTKEFFSLAFEVTPDVLIPRPETEILVERTIDLVRKSGAPVRTILDLGTGSGCIAVSLARHLPEIRVCASDVSEAVVEVARRNAVRHGVAGRIELRTGELFEPWRARRAEDGGDAAQFDVIVSNPPYVATAPGTPLEKRVRDHEPGIALFAGADGLDVIRRISSAAPAHISAGGHLLLEVGYDQAAAVRELLAAAGWRDIVSYRDATGHERVMHARR
ncbi:MAG: peptide chain release factor N(5)-glutamine methyltransferase [Planctomycetota bacterium]